MTREEARKVAEVMLAYVNGKEIEYTIKGMDIWKKSDRPTFNLYRYKYRVKPKSEKFDPKTLQPFDKVLVRNCTADNWKCAHFSHTEPSFKGKIYVTSMLFRDGILYNDNCIPYNEDTKHLVGTTDEAPEFYRYWEE